MAQTDTTDKPGAITRGYHLTVRDLRRLQACAKQVAVFAAEWPDGVDLTEAALLRAAELRLDLGWFAKAVLPAPAWATYEAACARALWAVLPEADNG